MEKFNDTKFFKSEEYRMVAKKSEWYEPLEYEAKYKFIPTAKYVRYLKEKKRREREEYILQLRKKLEWQVKEYGEVDPIDLQELMAYIEGTL